MPGAQKDRELLHTDENGNCKKCGEPLEYRSWERHCNYNKTHTTRFSEDITSYPCDLCDKVFHRKDQRNTHMKTREGCDPDKKSVWQRVGGGPPEPPQIDDDGNCKKCGGKVPRRAWTRHLSSKIHLAACPDDRAIRLCPCCQRDFSRTERFNFHIYEDDKSPRCRQQRPVKGAAGKSAVDKNVANAPQAGSSKQHRTKGKAPIEATGERGRANTQSGTQQQHLRDRSAKSSDTGGHASRAASTTTSRASTPDAEAYALLHERQGLVNVHPMKDPPPAAASRLLEQIAEDDSGHSSVSSEDLHVLFERHDISGDGGGPASAAPPGPHHRDSSPAHHRESPGPRQHESSDDSLPTAKDRAFLLRRQQTLSKGVSTALSRPHSQSRGKKS